MEESEAYNRILISSTPSAYPTDMPTMATLGRPSATSRGQRLPETPPVRHLLGNPRKKPKKLRKLAANNRIPKLFFVAWPLSYSHRWTPQAPGPTNEAPAFMSAPNLEGFHIRGTQKRGKKKGKTNGFAVFPSCLTGLFGMKLLEPSMVFPWFLGAPGSGF